MNAAQTFKRQYREAVARRRQFGMDSGDEFDRHDDADEPDDLDALDADDLPSADDESASPDQGRCERDTVVSVVGGKNERLAILLNGRIDIARAFEPLTFGIVPFA